MNNSFNILKFEEFLYLFYEIKKDIVLFLKME